MVPTDTIVEGEWAWIETDPILPASVDHFCQELFHQRGLGEKYNFLVYRFERDGVELSCRAYLDTVEEVTLHPARRTGDPPTEDAIAAAALHQDVLRFLTRRFKVVQELTAAGYEPIWMAGNYGALLAHREQRAQLQPELSLPPKS